MSSSARKRRSITIRQRSGTTGAGQPVKSAGGSAWPPCSELMLSVEARAASGTTGIAVRRAASAGNRLASISAITAPMCRTAQSPRNGIEPCAIRPKVSSSAHQTPRCPRQTRSLFSGSGMMTWSTRRSK